MSQQFEFLGLKILTNLTVNLRERVCGQSLIIMVVIVVVILITFVKTTPTPQKPPRKTRIPYKMIVTCLMSQKFSEPYR